MKETLNSCLCDGRGGTGVDMLNLVDTKPISNLTATNRLNRAQSVPLVQNSDTVNE